MSYELSREHEEFRRERPRLRARPRSRRTPRSGTASTTSRPTWCSKMGELGLFGLTAPEEYGGAGEDGDFTSLCVAIEEIGRVDQSMGITLEAGGRARASTRS